MRDGAATSAGYGMGAGGVGGGGVEGGGATGGGAAGGEPPPAPWVPPASWLAPPPNPSQTAVLEALDVMNRHGRGDDDQPERGPLMTSAAFGPSALPLQSTSHPGPAAPPLPAWPPRPTSSLYVVSGPFWCLRLLLTTVVFTTVLVAAGHAAACLCFVHEGDMHEDNMHRRLLLGWEHGLDTRFVFL